MNVLIAIPVSDEFPLEKATEHAKECEESIHKIFDGVVDPLNVYSWYSMGIDSPLKDLALIMSLIPNTNLVYFGKGWEPYRELKILHEVCEFYGIQRMEE